MKKDLYNALNKAKEERNLDELKRLYEENPDNNLIKLSYAKLCLYKNEQETGLKLLFELLEVENSKQRVYLALSKYYDFIGEKELAKEYFYKIEDNEVLSDNYLGLAKNASYKHDYELAKEYLLKRKGLTNEYNYYIELARLESAFKHNDEAIEFYNIVLTLKQNKKLFLEVADCYQKAKRFNEAKDLYLRALKEDHDCYLALLELARIENNRHNYDIAREYVDRALNVKYTDEAVFLLGKIELKSRNYEKAREYFNSVLSSEDVPIVSVLLCLGKTEFKLGNYEKAKEYFIDIKDEDPSVSYLWLGKIEAALNNLDAAENYFKLSSENGFNDTAAALELAKVYKKKSEYSMARDILIKMFGTSTRHKDKEYACMELATMERDLGNLESARDYFLWLTKTESYSIAYIELAKIETKFRVFENAKRYLEKLVVEGNMYAKLELGKLEEKLMNFNSARNIFKEIINSSTTKEYKSIALTELERLEIYSGNLQEAEEIIEEISKTEDKKFILLDIARLELKKGNIEKVYKNLQEYCNVYPDKDFDYELGKLYFDENNYEKAIIYFKKSLEKESEYNCDTMIYLGKSYFYLNEEEVAKDYFLKAFKKYNSEFAIDHLINLSIKEDNLNELFELMNKKLSLNMKLNKSAVYYIGKKLNIFYNIKGVNTTDSYMLLQLANYIEEEALYDIIQSHTKEGIHYEDSIIRKKEKSFFNESIDVEKLFYEMKDTLDDKYKLKRLSIHDVYIIPYENVGSKNENYLRIVTNPNSNEIIAMYPVDESFLDEKEEVLSINS